MAEKLVSWKLLFAVRSQRRKKKKIRCGAMGKPVNFKEPSGWEIKADGGSKTENEVFITEE